MKAHDDFLCILEIGGKKFSPSYGKIFFLPLQLSLL